MLKNDKKTYGSVAKFFHWVVVLGFISLFVIYYTGMQLDAKSGEMIWGIKKFEWYGIHKSIGITIFMIVVLRLVWKLINKRPDLDLPIPLKYAAKLNYLLLYVIMILFPVSGYTMSMADGYGVSWFGYDLPNLIGENPNLAEKANYLHESILPIMVYLFVGLHILASLFHHFILRDNTLRSMLPFVKVKK